MLLGFPLVTAVRDPEGDESSFLVAVGSGLAGTIAGLVSGDFISGVWFPAPISIALLWWLHPSRATVVRPAGVEVPTLVLSVAAIVPALAFLLTQAELQRNGVPSDPHHEFHHYSGMAATALAFPLCGIAASLRATGRALGVAIVGVAGVVVGGGSLLLTDHVGAFDPLWAWLALAWGIAVAATSSISRRRTVVPP